MSSGLTMRISGQSIMRKHEFNEVEFDFDINISRINLSEECRQEIRECVPDDIKEFVSKYKDIIYYCCTDYRIQCERNEEKENFHTAELADFIEQTIFEELGIYRGWVWRTHLYKASSGESLYWNMDGVIVKISFHLWDGKMVWEHEENKEYYAKQEKESAT